MDRTDLDFVNVLYDDPLIHWCRVIQQTGLFFKDPDGVYHLGRGLHLEC